MLNIVLKKKLLGNRIKQGRRLLEKIVKEYHRHFVILYEMKKGINTKD